MKICLDSGHWGVINRSPALSAYSEAERMWKLHLFLKDELQALGAEVVTTRQFENKDLELTKRGSMARGCDLFLSLHSNAVGNGVDEAVDYPLACVYSPDSDTEIDEISVKVGQILADVVADVMETSQKAKILTKKSLLDRDGDGILNDEWYGVLQGAKSVGVAGVLLEHSFHTQTRATKWLLEDSNLQKLAKAEARAIVDYFGGVAPADKLYRVQVGAFKVKANADKQLEELKKAGFNGFVVD